MRSRLLSVLVALSFSVPSAWAQNWRQIVPLKSTRADVERRFGKPDKWGGYDFKDERITFEYGEGSCNGLYLALGEDNCKCLAREDAVMSIFVEPKNKRKASDLKLNLSLFKKTPITPFPQTFEYSNSKEGIVYTVDEHEDEILHITYYPSPRDCLEIINQRSSKDRNSWRGLIPLKSNRRNVEALLQPARTEGQWLVTYDTEHETVVAGYSGGNCRIPGQEWNVSADTLVELVVNPKPSFLLKELRLDSSRYEKTEIRPYPEISNPPKVWKYIDSLNGIIIRTQASNAQGQEVVVSITYTPARKYENLRCK